MLPLVSLRGVQGVEGTQGRALLALVSLRGVQGVEGTQGRALLALHLERLLPASVRRAWHLLGRCAVGLLRTCPGPFSLTLVRD